MPGDWTRLLANDVVNMDGLKLLSLETEEDGEDEDVAAAVEEDGGNDGGLGRTNGLGCDWMFVTGVALF